MVEDFFFDDHDSDLSRSLHFMTTLLTVNDMRRHAHDVLTTGQTIGFVPTMGALHDGHAGLIRRAAQEHPHVVVSIFVNPTQFGPGEDFDRYPRTFEHDVTLATEAGATAIFAPSVTEMYPPQASTTVSVGGVTDVLEGASRPGHFDGVATIVSKLFLATQATQAYFGQKDLQQTLVVRQLVRDLLFPITITVVPTVREADGLAMSSRNVYLSTEDRAAAPVLYRALREVERLVLEAAVPPSPLNLESALRAIISQEERAHIDYAVVVDADTLRRPDVLSPGDSLAAVVAVRFGSTRLLDNHLFTVPS